MRSKIIILGAGPAGISAAIPLVKNGLEVMMLDAGGAARQSCSEPTVEKSLREMRDVADINLLGRSIEGNGGVYSSPKIRLSGLDSWQYANLNQIDSNNFNLIGLIGAGGLSKIWGGSCCYFDKNDVDGTFLSGLDLEESYREVSDRIGISGDLDSPISEFLGKKNKLQDAVSITIKAQKILDRYNKNYKNDQILLGKPHNAVITSSINKRLPCNGCMSCMWGCGRGSIYNANQDLISLMEYKNFTFISGVAVKKINKSKSKDWEIQVTTNASGANDSRELSFFGEKIISALGAFATTAVYLKSFAKVGQRLRAFSNPSFSAAIIDPIFFGKPLPIQAYGGAQLCFKVPLSSRAANDYAYGLLYDAASMPAYELMKHMPFTAKGAIEITKELLPTLSLLLVYLPGYLSDNYIELINNGSVKVTGGLKSNYGREEKWVQSELKNFFWKLKCPILPGSIKKYEAGSEAHYGGMLGGNALLTDACELKNQPGIYIVDGAALPVLPAKSHTLTIIANADRVAKEIARLFSK